MTLKEYDRTTNRQFEGRKVRSLVPLQNGRVSIPAGTVFIITRKHRGFHLRSWPCKHCGVQVHISRVGCATVELVP